MSRGGLGLNVSPGVTMSVVNGETLSVRESCARRGG